MAATRRTYEIVLSNIETDLRSGAIKPGDQLPGERALAQTYGISRASVREAVRILDAMGVVRTSSGSGPNSGAIVVSNPAAGLSSAFRYHVATRHLPVRDIVETRILLETWVGRAAAQQERDGAELDGVRGLLAAMDDPGLDQEIFHVLDAQFHVAVASLAGNAVIETIMVSLSQSIRGYVNEAVDKVVDWEEIAVTLRHQHHGILDAISDHDPDAAEVRLREHIEWFYHRTLSPDPGTPAFPEK
ncbi:FadR/GntR family transcriptional regulator [Paenarthrobacter sp. PH39-S1]|uniref:FadR/GntR family transcriptional regulator n=1 Tax=Micrococcaceae TaxID=1268 RepID=UPI0024BBBAAC|nr:FCD domain-containing protein [Paenarthrobacter sp. PH39-S1]MDJ0356992.1 FCD domain-containing protein [Paenarthrobacter sp. PH39-S1]